jgi:hypothetical protein
MIEEPIVLWADWIVPKYSMNWLRSGGQSVGKSGSNHCLKFTFVGLSFAKLIE